MSSTIRPILGSKGATFDTGGGCDVEEAEVVAVARHLDEHEQLVWL